MLRAISLAFASLSDRRVMVVLVKVIALTIAVFAVLGIAMWQALSWGLEYIGITAEAAPMFGGFLAFVATLFCMFLLFRIVAVTITWIFSDDIIDAIEDKYYAFSAIYGKRPSVGTSARMALRSLARVFGYNLLMIPVYLLLLFTGVGTPLAFLGLNGYLLGRDLEDMLVARHGPMRAEIGAIRRFVLGLGSVAAMLIPVFQFFVPVLATAAAVHVAHDKSGKM